MKTRRDSFANGFTLVELLAVITILILLAGALVVSVGYFSKRAGQARTQSILMMVEQGIKAFHDDYGVYPPDHYNNLLAEYFANENASNNPFSNTPSGGIDYKPEYKFMVYNNNSFNYSSEILYYFLKKRFETPQVNDGLYLPRKTAYIELMEYAVGDVDGDGNKEIVDAWGNPLLYVAKDRYSTESNSGDNVEPHVGRNDNSFSLYSYGNDGLGLYDAPSGVTPPAETMPYPIQHKQYSDYNAMLNAIDAKYHDTGDVGKAKANRDNVTNW